MFKISATHMKNVLFTINIILLLFLLYMIGRKVFNNTHMSETANTVIKTGDKAPNHLFVSKHNEFNLYSQQFDTLSIVFLSTECETCNKLVMMVKDSQVPPDNEIWLVYLDELPDTLAPTGVRILQTNLQTFIDYQITEIPYYVKLNSDQRVINSMPLLSLEQILDL